MNDEPDKLTAVKILDRTYKIKCPPDEAYDLQASAQYVDEQMRKIRQSGVVINTDRVAIVTALNISHELFQLRKQQNQSITIMKQRIHDLHNRVKKFLATEEEIAV